MTEANPLSVIQFVAEKRIEEALAQGAFDNLPGQGKPLHLEDMSHVPAELRMAYKILSNAGCLPPELEERKEIKRLADLLEHCRDCLLYTSPSPRDRTRNKNVCVKCRNCDSWLRVPKFDIKKISNWRKMTPITIDYLIAFLHSTNHNLCDS